MTYSSLNIEISKFENKQKNEFYNVALVLENSKSMVGAYKRVGLLVFKDIELVTAKLTWERKRLTLI